MRIRVVFILLVLSPLMALAQDSQAKKQSWLVRGVMKVKTLIDSMAVKGIDRSYIEQPERPWAVELRTTAGEATINLESDMKDFDLNSTFRTKFKSRFSTSAGVWLGYRGYGLGLSKELTGGDGSSLSLGAMGGSFGINFRLHTYNIDEAIATVDNIKNAPGGVLKDEIKTDETIKVKALFLDAYYMFNGKHFSYAAAYDQSLIQRRSAGSFVVGGMYYHTSVDYACDDNGFFMLLMNRIGKIKYTQANIGAGYAYNWVPAKGWLVSVMAMPMLALYNRTTLYTYKFENISEKDEPEDIEDFKVMVYGEKMEKLPNKVSWNYDARLSVVYNWTNVYLRAYGHYNHFRFGDDDAKGWQDDWMAYASLGIRF